MSSEAEFAKAREALSALRRIRNPRLRKAAQSLAHNRFDDAERLILQFLENHPDEPEALNLQAETAIRRERYEDAEAPLARCIALSPGFIAARFNYANALFRLTRASEAIVQIDVLLEKEPRNPLFCDLKAAACAKMGRFDEALNYRRKLVEDFPDSARVWVAYGHALRAMALPEQCISAFRQAIGLSRSLGEAYWGLANLKTYRFTEMDIAEMDTQLSRSDLSGVDRTSIHYALGKALGDLELWAKSFENYAKANAIMRLGAAYDADWTTSRVRSYQTALTPEFFKAHSAGGCSAKDPIFIVGMQRAGSTLVEQILASHSAIEGLGELTDIAFLARQIPGRSAENSGPEYLKALGTLHTDHLTGLGEQYLEATRHRRKTERPHFTDKQPYNFWHVGLIKLILPNARIIDVRRHPLGCCFSNFTHLYATNSRPFTHRLADLGRYYRDYVGLMAHFDRALPGRIYRVIYERLVYEPEAEIRRLLDHLGLPFEPACVEFYKNARRIDSASSEQVRTPIFRDGVERWRHYEPWLAPLIPVLGPVLDSYPEAPAEGSIGM